MAYMMVGGLDGRAINSSVRNKELQYMYLFNTQGGFNDRCLPKTPAPHRLSNTC